MKNLDFSKLSPTESIQRDINIMHYQDNLPVLIMDNDNLIETMTLTLRALNERIENDEDIEDMIIKISKNLSWTFDENGNFLNFFASLDKYQKFLSTPSGQLIQQAVSQGMDFSDVLESMIDPDALERLSALVKV